MKAESYFVGGSMHGKTAFIPVENNLVSVAVLPQKRPSIKNVESPVGPVEYQREVYIRTGPDTFTLRVGR